MIVPVILCGGAGTRLWPLSREQYPKQLLALHGDSSLLQETVARLQRVPNVGRPLVVCNEAHRFMVGQQLQGCGAEIILEPCARNTAPALAIAALQAMADGADPVLLVLPADHLIREVEAFVQAVATGQSFAQARKMVTFGIVADQPETGYGYIQVDRRCAMTIVAGQLTPAAALPLADYGFAVAGFVEKPDAQTARSYLESGDYYWNSGMFMVKASLYLAELERFDPAMLNACRDAHRSLTRDLDFLRLDGHAFAACRNDSIDYAVMEKTAQAVVVPLDAGWSDVGSWLALWETGPATAEGNVIQGDVLTTATRNCYLYAGSRLVAGVGIDNLVVVETADAVLVAAKDRVQEVKAIVEQLKSQHRVEALLHRRVHRPWGSYECVDSAQRFQVKRITVNPGARLSLQLHHHRAEHWVVVSGTARVTCADKICLVSENESIYIPIGVAHRLENPGILPLELIEVQSGSYLGEDDIVRLDDLYGRRQPAAVGEPV